MQTPIDHATGRATAEDPAQAVRTTGPAPADRAGDETAIRGLIEQMQDAWARADADAFGVPFTDDADYVVFDGTHLRGRQEIAAAHIPLWNGFLEGSRLVGVESSVRFVTADVALIHSKGAVLKQHEQKPSRRSLSVQTMVAVRQDGTWRIAAFQNTRYRPFADTLFGKLMMRMARRKNQQSDG
jgi:uncharacterized protein (TIGR02246 family)